MGRERPFFRWLDAAVDRVVDKVLSPGRLVSLQENLDARHRWLHE